MKNLAIFLMILSASLCFGFTDSADTVGLWHCNSIYEAATKFYTPDDDSLMTGRNYELELRNGVALASPGVDGTGSALDFDGVNDFGMKTWGLHNNIKIELAFKADTLTSGVGKYFVEVAGIWRLYISTTNLVTMTVWDSAGLATTKNLTAALSTGTWYKLEASYASSGLFRLFLYNANGDLLDGLEGTYGSGTMAKTGTPNFVLGSYRGTGQFFDGQIDEVKLSNYISPEWTQPYIDVAGTVSALWHFDNFADPNTSGVTYKLLPDDDSDNPGRGKDLKVYSGLTTLVNNGQTTGPSLVDPDSAGVGYPANNPAFGKAAYFDDPILVEGDSFRTLNSALSIDPTNVRVDCWVRPADELVSLVPGAVVPYYIVDRWGQFYIALSQAADGSLSIIAMSFGSAGATDNKSITYVYTDPARWINVSYRFYQGTAQLYINGSLVGTVILTTQSLMTTTSKPDFYIGKRYNSNTNYFWGYIDEFKISQTVYNVGCGAWGYLPGDIDENCVVGISDLDLLADQWLMTTEPSDPQAVEGTMAQYQNYNIPLAVTAPTIDGTLSAGEWVDATRIFLGMPELTTSPNIGSQAYAVPDSHADFSAEYFFKWDAQYLYVGIKVYDDALVFDAGYPDDHVTLAFNPLKAGTVSADVAFYNMFRDYFGASNIVNQAGFNQAFNPANAIKASAAQANGWSFEVAYKWSDFNGYTPTLGDVHGTAILICDNDVADGLRDTFLMDAGSGNTGIIGLPSLYKSATLTSGISCGDTGYLADDINQDCDVNLFDYADMADQWLGCSTPGTAGCVDAR